MALEKMTENVEIVQTLSTYPNQEDGLSAEELKAKFDAGAKALKEYLNGQVVPAVQELERVVDPGMAYGLDPTLSVAGRAADAGAVGTALAGKAPAGFGLGTTASYRGIATIAELDNIKVNGKFLIAQTAGTLSLEGVAFNILGLDVFMTDNTHGEQSVIFTDGRKLRRVLDGAWQPWEWVNPPMIPGVEYRTTERWNGKPVWTVLVDLGSFAAGRYE